MNHTLKQMLPKGVFFFPQLFLLFSAPTQFGGHKEDMSGAGAGRVFGKEVKYRPSKSRLLKCHPCECHRCILPYFHIT